MHSPQMPAHLVLLALVLALGVVQRATSRGLNVQVEWRLVCLVQRCTSISMLVRFQIKTDANGRCAPVICSPFSGEVLLRSAHLPPTLLAMTATALRLTLVALPPPSRQAFTVTLA